MSEQLRYDGKVAIVTGAGGGLGRAYALLLAARGARVLVNDLGSSAQGAGHSARAADGVVEEIRALGGEAWASYDSVEDGGKIVQAALDQGGGLDIVINNAGILRDASFAKMSEQDWDLVYQVHALGSFRVTHAAWPHLRERRYGRVIMTASAAGLYGNFGQANYSLAKMGLVGLARTLALEGAARHIQVNVIAPLAGSRLLETVAPEEVVAALKPDYVAALVAYLCHHECTENGGIFEVGGGLISKLRWQRSEGVHLGGRPYAPEDVASHWARIIDFERSTYPTSVAESMAQVFDLQQVAPVLVDAVDHTDTVGAIESAQSTISPALDAGSSKVRQMFAAVARHVSEHPELVAQIDTLYQWHLEQPSSDWVLDLKHAAGACRAGRVEHPDCTLRLSEADFLALSSGELDPQQLFFAGRLSISGNLMAAQKLGFLKQLRPTQAGHGVSP